MKTISIVIPCYNEADCIKLVYNELNKIFSSQLSQYQMQVIFVDDGSRDHTMREIKDLAEQEGEEKVKYISFSRNFGKEAAIYAGLEYAKGDYVAVMDADLQHPPALLIEMVYCMEKEDVDCVGAKRVARNGDSFVRKVFSNVFFTVFNRITGMNFVQGMTDYRLMKQKVVASILSLQERERFTKGIYSWIGFHIKWIEYKDVERKAGESKWHVMSLWNYALSGLIAFAVAPLRGIIWMGMLGVLVSVIYGIQLFVHSVTGARPWQDTTTIIFLLLFFGSMIITILGVIGEYLARIYLEVKKRPIYISRESNIIGEKLI